MTRPPRAQDASEPPTRWVESGGVRLAAWERGDPDGPAVVLLHGLTGTHDYVLMRNRGLERAGFRVVAYDARGHGRSTQPPERAYEYADLTADLAAVMDAFGIVRALMVGVSMGCHTALRYARSNRERVEAIVGITPAYHPVWSFLPETLARWDSLADGLRRGGPEGFVAAYGRPLDASRTFEAVMRLLARRLWLHEHPQGVADALEVVPRSRPYARIEDVGAVRAPALVIGSRDHFDVEHRLAVAEQHAAALDARLVVEPEGKFPIPWSGGRVVRLVREFARDVRGRPTAPSGRTTARRRPSVAAGSAPEHAVAVTGIGAVTALGMGVGPLVERWIAGEHGIRDGVARCHDFDPTGLLDRKEKSRSDRFSQLALVAAGEACRQAGWESALPYEPARVGVVLGTCFGGQEAQSRFEQAVRTGGPVSPFALPMMMPNAAGALISMRLGAVGPSYAVGTACAASTDAIGMAMRMIRSGQLDAVVTGGSEACVTPLLITASTTMGAMSKSGICRPFDRRRDGFVIGEGAAILVLERADRAEARGAEVLAELAGYGCTTDAHHLTSPEPSGVQAALAMRLALEDGGVAAEEVDYVNAHGTSTPLNDQVESQAITVALGAEPAPVSSTKSAIGHLVGAAGAAEAVATIGALRMSVLPPTIGHELPDDGMDLDYLPHAREIRDESQRPLVALANSFGFGGHNSVLCLRVPRVPAAMGSARESPTLMSETAA